MIADVNSLANLHLSPGSSLILYADDILLYRALCSADDNSILQHDVDSSVACLDNFSRPLCQPG